MSPKEELIAQLGNLKTQLSGKYPIAAMALFGSFSRDEQSNHSDIDILVEFNGKIGSGFIELADELETALGRKVDLISRNGIKPKYFSTIKKDLIYI